MLVVRENRTRSSVAVVKLPVTINRSRSTTPAPDPVLYMAGGPGGSVQRIPLSVPFLETRDYVTLEARGTRNAEPALECPEVAALQSRKTHGLVRGAALDSSWIVAASACAQRLRAQGVDLGAYTTRAIADDVEDLRKTLRIDRWNLYGASYSTRIMLTVMREHPAGVRSVVLDSPLPPESRFDETAASGVLRAWDIAFNTCAVVATCVANHPRTRDLLAEALRRFEAQPQWVSLGANTGGDSVFLSGELLGHVLGTVMNGPGSAQVSAMIVERAAAGDIAPLVPLLAADAAPSSYTWGMRMLVWCSDVVPFEDRARVAAQRSKAVGLGGADFSVVPGPACDAAGIPPSPAIEGEAVRSGIPTLILSGSFDPNTPTPWARALIPNLPNAFLIEFAGLAHVPGFRPCGTALIDAFFRDPARPPTDACVAHGPGLIIR